MAVQYPHPGCIVEFLEDNAPKIAVVLEEAGNKLRLLLPGRRETRLAPNRILPWIGPALSPNISKDEAEKKLEEHLARRKKKKEDFSALDAWEMANGEIAQAPASWFAELFETEPDYDAIAACGHALLECKTHFRFQSPDFTVFDAELVEKRLAEQKARAEREEITSTGTAFLKLLWEVASQKKELPKQGEIYPDPDLAERIKAMLFARLVNPDSDLEEPLWRMLSKGLPDVPHLPMQLLEAWGLVPRHYNFWLDRADYSRGDSWWKEFADKVDELASLGLNPELPQCDLPFVSIDGESTLDIDDAFYLERSDNGYTLTVALAAPALHWPFGEPLDKCVAHRATSIYLPEGDLHMLPEILGTDSYSLKAGEIRPAFCARIDMDENGACTNVQPFIAKVKLAANLRYAAVQDFINGSAADSETEKYGDMLALGHELALKRQALRIDDGAVIMLRQEPELELVSEGNDVRVDLKPEKPCRDAQRVVSEIMILAGASLADWAKERNIPLLHRTQSVTLPPEYAGIWEEPAMLAQIMHSLAPSMLEVEARPHAALGLKTYAQMTSPLRRYTDLINEAQILNFLEKEDPLWNEAELKDLLASVTPSLDAAAHVQRFRPRYWKLLHFKQVGDKVWHEGIITEENEIFANVALPAANIFIRGRRNIFDERAAAGARVKVRLGKINPLLNEIQILEAISDD